MHRFFCDNKENNSFLLDKDLLHHIKVARLENDNFLINYQNQFYKCKLNKTTLCADIIEQVNIDNEYKKDLVLAAPIIKPERFEWMIEKATELGVKKIIPMLSQFCNHKYAQNNFSDKKMQRYKAKILSAAEQSFRNVIPEITSVQKFTNIIDFYIEKGYKLYLAHELVSTDNTLDSIETDSVVLIGPEGGFSQSEIDYVASKNYDQLKIISLGKTILRAETAAIKMLSKIKEK